MWTAALHMPLPASVSGNVCTTLLLKRYISTASLALRPHSVLASGTPSHPLPCVLAAAERVADYLGSQCGFCTPGMVVACTAALQACGGEMSSAGAEGALDGNLCRCTGYRPLLDALKSFGSDVPVADIEDLPPLTCAAAKKPCRGGGREAAVPLPLPDGFLGETPTLSLRGPAGTEWRTVPSTGAGMRAYGAAVAAGQSVAWVAGNTAAGLYKGRPKAALQLHIGQTPELRVLQLATGGCQPQMTPSP